VVVKIVRSAARPGSSCAKLPRVLRGLPSLAAATEAVAGLARRAVGERPVQRHTVELPVGVLAGVRPYENSPAYDRRDTPL